MEYLANQVFENIKSAENPLVCAEFEACTFKQCNFSNADMRNFQFTDCKFYDCNWSNANITNAAFRNCFFEGCKMLGLAFYSCNSFLFQLSTSHCDLGHCSFYKMNIQQSKFVHSVMCNIDFTECNASQCIFDECDLKDAQFVQTNLTKAKLVSAYNFTIQPEINTLKQTRFAKSNMQGLLAHLDIHIE
ncbi:MAG: pentapeptide repeat-containing protein [Bacteroidia bacterium]|jgi:uncharacterized protein YjbI with pentapeptide repeats|nr:pentapeptide repeat-containing protein [Bacteroidia bacterium]